MPSGPFLVSRTGAVGTVMLGISDPIIMSWLGYFGLGVLCRSWRIRWIGYQISVTSETGASSVMREHLKV